MSDKNKDISDDLTPLVGRVLTSVGGGTKGDDVMTLHFADGSFARFWHDQDCCESVRIEDVAGDWADLIGAPLSRASVESNKGGDPAPEYPESWTWTFYRFAGGRGTVVVRWLGESNGYYGEDVSAWLTEVPRDDADLNALAMRLKDACTLASQCISDINDGKKRWTLSVPARPGEDADLVFSALVCEATAAANALAALSGNPTPQTTGASSTDSAPSVAEAREAVVDAVVEYANASALWKQTGSRIDARAMCDASDAVADALDALIAAVREEVRRGE